MSQYKVVSENLTDDTQITYRGPLPEMIARYNEECASFEREGWTQVYGEEVDECIDTMSEWQYTDGETIILSLSEA